MILYFGLAILLFPVAVYCSSKEYVNNVGTIGLGKSILFSFILFTIILGGIRWETGTDWKPYLDFFSYNITWKQFNSPWIHGDAQFKFSYTLLNFFVKQCTDSYTVLLFIMSFAVILLRYNTIKTIALYPVLSYYLFFCLNIGGMFPVRHHIAQAIALTSIYFIQKKRKIAFVLITLLAVSFHYALIIWFIAYPIYHIRTFKPFMVITLFIIATIIGIFGWDLIIWIVQNTVESWGVSGRISAKTTGYMLGSYSDGSFSMFGVVRSVSRRLVFVILFLALRHNLFNKYIYANGLVNIFLISVIIQSIFSFNENWAPMARIVAPFIFTEVLLIPSIIILYKSYIKYILILFLFLYGLFRLYAALNGFPESFIPYRSIFSVT